MKLRHLLITLICIIIFLGCGGGGGGSGVGPELVSGFISGQITFDETLANERAVIASHSTLRASSFDNVLVFLEEMPTRATYADTDGKYSFTDLPLNTSFHIITCLKTLSGKEYKNRSDEILLGKGKAQVTKNIKVGSKDEAKYQIRFQVKDTKDNNVSKCKIWLWGEEFTIDESGCYLSPKMPLGAVGLLKVVPPSNKDLLNLEWQVDSNAFQSEIQGVSAVTLPPSGITNKKAPFVSIKVGETISGGFALRLYGNAVDPQNDSLELEWSTSVGSFTYENIDKSYVDWGVPSEETTAVITLKASQVSSSNYPLFWSKAELPIKISKNGTVSYPGEVVVQPVLRHINIISSASEQITANTVSAYDVIASFPNDLKLFYNWKVSDGTIVSGQNSKRMYWQSPSLKAKENKLATLTAYVTDEVATISKSILVNITSFPVITFTSPQGTEFYPGKLSFTAVAKDYEGNFIPYEEYKWYLATHTSKIVLMQNEGASFTYNFAAQGTYTVYLSAKDSLGVVGTGSADISIINVPPEITILSPLNDAGYTSSNHLVFKAKVKDYEDGEITAPEQITWFSDVDGKIGSGTFFVYDSLTKNKEHRISVVAKDSQGAVSSESVLICYDMPARITLTPETGATFFEGSKIDFYARGLDGNGSSLSSSTYKWYLDGDTTPWRSGVERFSVNDLPSGIHSIKVIGANVFGEVTSNDYYFEVGWPLPNITNPASGSRFDLGTNITFTAVPTSTGTLEMNWYIDDNSDSAGTNNRLITELPEGFHSIRYQGMDYASTIASSIINIVVERKPIIELNYASGAYFFDGHPIIFHANCLDSSNNNISDEKIKWYILDSGSPVLLKTGSIFSLGQGTAEGLLSSGTHKFIVQATGPYGTVASLSLEFESGIEPLSILSPLPEMSYEINSDISFKSNIAKESIPINWYVDGNLINTSSSNFTKKFEEGVYTVKAIATDSSNISSSDEVILNVGLFPVMDISVKDIWNNNIDPSNCVFFTGKSIVFVGTGTSPIDGNPVDPTLMTWSICNEDGITGKESFSGFSEITVNNNKIAALGQGTGTVELRCDISEGFVGIKIKKMYFNLPLASYDTPASNTFITFDDYESERVVVTPSGYPDSVGSVNYEWYLDWGKPGCTKLNDSNSSQNGIQLLLKKGENYLSLVATDSLGEVSIMTKKILIDNRPTLSFSPPLDFSNIDAYIFEGFDLTLMASGTAAVGTSDLINYKWYLGDSSIAISNGTNSITNTELGLVKGKNKVTLSAEDEYGIAGSICHNIYFGEQIPEILYPEENQSFQDTNIQFIATGSELITMKWNLNDKGFAESDKNITILKNDTRLVNGDNKIVFGGKDSEGNEVYVTRHFNYASSNKLPKIEIKLANNMDIGNAIIFTLENSETLTLIGSATGAVDHDIIEASKMDWTLYKQDDESSKQTFSGINSLTLRDTVLNSVGTWTINLSVTDRLGFKNTFTTSFYYGYPVPEITSPENPSVFSKTQGENINFEGNNISDVTLKHCWYTDSGEKIGSVYSITESFGRGYHKIYYIATDTAGVEKRDFVEFIVNDNPSIDINLFNESDSNYYQMNNDSKFFASQTLTLKGIAKKCDNTEINNSDVKWLKCNSETDNGITIVNGEKEPVLSESVLGKGTWYLRFVAEDKDFSSYAFSENYLSSMTVMLTTGIATPTFIGAEDGKRIDENTSISFIVNDVSPLIGHWSIDDPNASSPVTIKDGDNMTFTANLQGLPRGYHTVYYGATDSGGKTITAQTSILVDSGPKFIDGPKISTPPPATITQLGTGKAGGLNYSIIKSENSIINLTLSAETASESNSISWHSYSETHESEEKSFNRNYSIGSYTYLVTIEDEYGIATSTTLSFWVWGYENCGPFNVRNSLVSNGTSNLFISDSETKITRLTRITDSNSSNCGKISIDNSSTTVELASLFYSGSDVYSLTQPSDGNNPILLKWKASNLSLDASQPVIDDDSISDFGGFIIKNTKIYITDRSSNTANKVKIYYNDGKPFTVSAYTFKKPYGIADLGTKLIVADTADSKIVTLDLNGNYDGQTLSVPSPYGVIYSSTSKKIYAASDNAIYIIDSNTFEILYSFEVAEGVQNLTICGTGNISDLYVSLTNGKIVRVRSGYTW